MKNKYTNDILKSLITRDNTLNSTQEILDWVDNLNKSTHVELRKISLEDCKGWEINDSGIIQNSSGTFFKISGIKSNFNGLIEQQPILLQDEIGFLGIIVKKIQGILYFLIQAKIEPGNINKIQLSPTVQATKSNFKQKHGGNKPKYVEFFENAKDYSILYDQIQSEQSSRFLGKRNRNIIIDIGDSHINIEKNWKWMTLGQIKDLLKYDNLVNMDTRTVLSGLPMYVGKFDKKPDWFKYDTFYDTLRDSQKDNFTDIYNYINNYKMFNDIEREKISLRDLNDWQITKDEIIHKNGYSFKVVFYEIEIEGREVKKWTQPLFQAIGKAKFILVTSKVENKYIFLVKATSEIGAFDNIEIGPTIQKEASEQIANNELESILLDKISRNEGILRNVVLSEEGGRFYHEENDNIIIKVDFEEINKVIEKIPGYFWLDYNTILNMMKINNVLNIQLRNLISLVDIEMN